MTSFINDETIEKVRESLDIVDIVSDYLVLKKTGSNYVGLCPFHSEKTPSFSVSPAKEFFHCFGCGQGGDGITFIMKQENLDFPHAIKFLADKYGIAVEEKQVEDSIVQERKKAYEMNREAARFFYKNLRDNKFPRNYLSKRYIGPDIIRNFGLGYSMDSWNNLYNYMTKKGYKDEELEKIGLIGRRSGNNGYYDRFRNRIIFPIIDTRSRIIGFGGRILDDSMPKYLNSKETIVFNKGDHLYGLNLVSKESNRKRILLVEGYMDVIALYSKGINYSVASLGTALTPNQAKLIKRYGEDVYICYDSDIAGINATLKAIDILVDEGVNPKVILLPNEMDPDDYINKKGLMEFEKLILNSFSYIDYKIHIFRKDYDLNKLEEKVKFTVQVSNIIKSIKSPIEQDAYINKVSEETGISKEAIEQEINKKSYSGRPYRKSNKYLEKKTNETISPINNIILSAHLKAETDLIKLMIYEKDYYEIINRKISKDDFQNKDYQEIYEIINNLYSIKETINMKDIVQESLNKEDISKETIQSISQEKMEYKATNIEQILNDLINTITFGKLERKRRNILKDIEELEKIKDRDEYDKELFMNLCLELTKVNREIKLI